MKDQVKKLAGAGMVPLSLFTGLGAVAASSCCALPLALSAAGIGSTWLSGLGDLAIFRPWLLGVAAIALALAWLVTLRRMATCAAADACARSRCDWLTFAALGLSTCLVGVAAAWRWVEPALVAALLRPV